MISPKRFYPSVVPWLLVIIGGIRSMPFASSVVNVTVDDASSTGVTYSQASPPQQLASQSHFFQGATCDTPHCSDTPSPDTNSAFNGTWHKTSAESETSASPAVIQLNFTGTAIYIYAIVAKTWTGSDNTTATILISAADVNTVDPSNYETEVFPASEASYTYNVLIYAKSDFTNGPHSVMMTATAAGAFSFVMFDYAVYTSVEGTTLFEREMPIILVGSVLSFVLLSATVVVVGLRCYRKRKIIHCMDVYAISPFSIDGGGDTGPPSETTNPVKHTSPPKVSSKFSGVTVQVSIERATCREYNAPSILTNSSSRDKAARCLLEVEHQVQKLQSALDVLSSKATLGDSTTADGQEAESARNPTQGGRERAPLNRPPPKVIEASFYHQRIADFRAAAKRARSERRLLLQMEASNQSYGQES